MPAALRGDRDGAMQTGDCPRFLIVAGLPPGRTTHPPRGQGEYGDVCGEAISATASAPARRPPRATRPPHGGRTRGNVVWARGAHKPGRQGPLRNNRAILRVARRPYSPAHGEIVTWPIRSKTTWRIPAAPNARSLATICSGVPYR